MRYLVLGAGIEEIEYAAFWNVPCLYQVAINNKYAFENINSDTGLTNSKTIKVPKSVADNATNDYLNNTDNFTKTTDGDYYIYTRVNN